MILRFLVHYVKWTFIFVAKFSDTWSNIFGTQKFRVFRISNYSYQDKEFIPPTYMPKQPFCSTCYLKVFILKGLIHGKKSSNNLFVFINRIFYATDLSQLVGSCIFHVLPCILPLTEFDYKSTG